MPIDLNDPEVKAAIDAAVASGVAGLKTNRDTILAEKKQIEDALKEAKGAFGDLDPKVVKNLVERMKNDEETKLIAEGKIDEVIARRTEALSKDYEAKIAAKEKSFSELDASAKLANQKVQKLILESVVRQAAGDLNLIPSAMEDAIYRASNVFSLTDDLKPIAKQADGTPIYGKDAKSPMTAKEWLEGMKEAAPHWFPGSSGINAGGGKGNQGVGQFSLTREQARDPRTYQTMKAQADKAGQQVQIVE